ncbi:hypothetical protein CARUB_v100279781mg, partial [Capsella rubella]
GEGDCGWF